MRLLDRVSQCRSPIVVQNNDGTRAVLPGADRFATRVRDCPQRFVLDADASALCRTFLDENVALLEPSDRFVRAPSASFWLEWWTTLGSAGELTRVGVLFDGDQSGRRGSLRSFWEEGAEISIAAGSLKFDFDGEPVMTSEAARIAKLNHTTNPVFRPLLAHVALEIDPEWHDYFCYHGPGLARDAVRRVAEGCWFDLPYMLAFGMLLGLKGPFRERRSDLGRLNSARARKGNSPLLDHVEIALALGEGRIASDANGASTRSSPRLHQVRGHVVKRGDGIFWRNSHLRGSAGVLPLRRTVSVTVT